MNRRDFLYAGGLGALGVAGWPQAAAAIGGRERLAATQLRPWPGAPNPRPNGIRRMLQEVEKRTSVEVDTGADPVGFGPELFEHPMLFLSGDQGFDPWPAEQVDLLRTWLKGGGFLVVDSSEGVQDGPFLRSARRELGRVWRGQKPRPVPPDHVLYKSFYLLDEPHGRLKVSPKLLGYFEGDRVPAVLCANDVQGAWARDGFGRWEYDVVPGGDRQREMAFRFGVNLAMYALCVNYKADQVHIDFILKRRQWRVK